MLSNLPVEMPIVLVDFGRGHSIIKDLLASMPVQCVTAPDMRTVEKIADHEGIALLVIDESRTGEAVEFLTALKQRRLLATVPVLLIANEVKSLVLVRQISDISAVASVIRHTVDRLTLHAQILQLLQDQAAADRLRHEIAWYLRTSTDRQTNDPLLGLLLECPQRRLWLDPATGVSNSLFFKAHLDISIKRAARHSRGFALACLDFDPNHRLLKKLGSTARDQVFAVIAQRLERAMRAADVIARVDAVHFALLLDGVNDVKQGEAVVAKLLAQTAAPVEMQEHPSAPMQYEQAIVKAGVALYPHHGKDAQMLWTVATHACLAAIEAHNAGPEADIRVSV